MPPQRASYTLAAHKSSVKQVKFQPGNASVIATCSRDGSIRIWDLRCQGSQAPAQEIRVSLDGPEDSKAASGPAKSMTLLSPRHEHLLISASEGDASVKLWDLRTTHTLRRSTATVTASSLPSSPPRSPSPKTWAPLRTATTPMPSTTLTPTPNPTRPPTLRVGGLVGAEKYL
ncbi:MAG: hypothetical protein L6R41_003902 [Letrouitia leprolyta]|nr:MAG: hypothetical protein L6R41_003902 [Letrouitia leprolyta]